MESQIIETSVTLVDVLHNFLRFLFAVFFLGASLIFLYLGVVKYLLAKSPQIQETNKMVLFVSLGLIFLISAFFAPILITNFILSLLGKEEIKPLPNKGVILKPSGKYEPLPIPGSSLSCECNPGATKCAGEGFYQVCLPSENTSNCGYWSSKLNCSYNERCESGKCVPFNGIPPEERLCDCYQFGQTRCVDENSYQICYKIDENCGRWSNKIECSNGMICLEGRCRLFY